MAPLEDGVRRPSQDGGGGDVPVAADPRARTASGAAPTSLEGGPPEPATGVALSPKGAPYMPGLEPPRMDVGLPPRSPIVPPPRRQSNEHRSPTWEAKQGWVPSIVEQDGEEEGDDVSHISNPDSRVVPQSKRNLTLDDLASSNPLEAEVETYIQRTLDANDALGSALSDAQQTILGHVPEDAEPDAFEEPPTTAADPRSRLQRLTHGLYAESKKRSLAGALYELTHCLEKLSNRNLTYGMQASEEYLPNQTNKVKNGANIARRANVTTKGSSETDSNGEGKANGENNVSDSAVDEGESDEDPLTDSLGMSKGKQRAHRSHHMQSSNKLTQLRLGYKDFEEWVGTKKSRANRIVKYLLLLLMIPALGAAAILFYAAGNPPCGTNDECLNNTEALANSSYDIHNNTKEFFDEASASWWILFVCCRHPVTLCLALITHAFIIDFLALRTKLANKIVGPFVTLFIVQSSGWPFVLFFWSIYDFILLFGSRRFAHHWLFWQDVVGLFNETNPSGNITSSSGFQRILVDAILVSVVVAIKRSVVGLWLGRKTFFRYAEELASVMKKALLIGQLAVLAREKEQLGFELSNLGLDVEQYGTPEETNEEDGSKANATNKISDCGSLIREANMSSLQKERINELLGAWEEPEIINAKESKAPIGAIIQFRQSLSYLNTNLPFSAAFGPAANRKECVASSEAVYNRLLGGEPILKFDSIAAIAVNRDGSMDEEKLKALITLFRPERDGTLSLIDFARSIDSVYKELRLLRASVASSSKMDVSFEGLINVAFYFVVYAIALAIMGVDPMVLFASISSFVLGFSFMIGQASAQYFIGILFIILRRPFDIGDRINVSNPIVDTPTTGSPGWVVLDFDLFKTTVVYGSTNEVATIENSAMSIYRIINAGRSKRALANIYLNFPIDVPYKKLQVFRGAVEAFVKDRPREWGAFCSFRASTVSADQGYIQYSLCCEHREGWQMAGVISQSKAELTSFCLELSKKMNIRYHAPPMPIDLNMVRQPMASDASLPLETMARTYRSVEPLNPSAGRAAPVRPLTAQDSTNTAESFDWRAVSTAMFGKKE